MIGTWTVALPAPLGLRPWRMTCLELVLLARFRLPVVVPGTPRVKPPAPCTATVPVKLAVDEMVWPLRVPPMVALLVTARAVPAAENVLVPVVKVLPWLR